MIGGGVIKAFIVTPCIIKRRLIDFYIAPLPGYNAVSYTADSDIPQVFFSSPFHLK
jgi:hypothetical protein